MKNGPHCGILLCMDKKIIQRLPNETSLAWQYFQLYCEMPPAERSLQALCDRDVTGKKRSVAVFKRWSTQHNWQARAALFDFHTQQAAAEALFERRQAEISTFVEKDLQVSRHLQDVCIQRIKEISESDNIDATELRQLAMTYTQSREWIKELIGIVQLQRELDGGLEDKDEEQSEDGV